MKLCLRCQRLKKSKKFPQDSPICLYCQNKRRNKVFSQRFNLTRPISKGSERRKNIKRNGGFYTKSQWASLKKRYKYTCLRCGCREPLIKLQADHIIPVIRGGSSWIDNIQPLCGPCNVAKGQKIWDYRKEWVDTEPDDMVN